MSDAVHGGAVRRPGELWRILAGWTVVLAATAGALALLDAAPTWILGEPRDVRRAPTLQDAERRLRTRLALPAYFPDSIAWPARTIRVMGGPAGGAALEFDGRDGRPRLFVAQGGRPGALPARLVPEANALDAVPLALGASGGTLRRVVGPDGEVWQEIRWRLGDREMLLRLRGSVDEAVRMAKSAREAP